MATRRLTLRFTVLSLTDCPLKYILLTVLSTTISYKANHFTKSPASLSKLPVPKKHTILPLPKNHFVKKSVHCWSLTSSWACLARCKKRRGKTITDFSWLQSSISNPISIRLKTTAILLSFYFPPCFYFPFPPCFLIRKTFFAPPKKRKTAEAKKKTPTRVAAQTPSQARQISLKSLLTRNM